MNDKVHLDHAHVRHLLTAMLRIRRFEEKCFELYQGEKIRGFMHLYDGEEAVSVGVIEALQPQDAIVATYREHGQALARGISMNALMAEMYGKLEGCCRGRGGSMHIFDRATRFYGGNAIVGGGLPLAVGTALGDKMLGRSAVATCFFGDGAVDEGAFHESMNLASLWQLPVLFACENNGYAMGTALERSESETDLCAKAASYRVPAAAVDGMDVVAVRQATQTAAEAVRSGGGPRFLEFRTYRFRAHSMFDPERYRPKAEVEQWKQRGPLHTFTDRLKAQQLFTEADFERLEAEVAAELRAAIEFAERSDLEPVADLTRDVVAPEPPA